MFANFFGSALLPVGLLLKSAAALCLYHPVSWLYLAFYEGSPRLLDCLLDRSVNVHTASLRIAVRRCMPDAIENQVMSLSSQDRKHLLAIWREHFPETSPPSVRKELLVAMITYKLQERVHGGLSQSSRRQLREIARSFAPEKRNHPSLAPHLMTGTRLIRSWQGKIHEVTVADSGFEYNGRHFDNLSIIAREITGTRWSGPLFFGTKRRPS